MKVNIVMLTKDRRRLVSQTMRTLYANTDPKLYNLTIVDDDSAMEDNPARDFALLGRPEQTAMLTVTNSKGITGQARNLGVYWAEKYWGRGDYLYLTDNDVYFTPGWLETLVGMFERTTGLCDLLGGWNHPYLKPGPIPPSVLTMGGTVVGRVEYHDAVAGPSQLMKWATWDKYGPLDAHAKGVCQGEDWQFCQNIIKDGGRVGSIYPRVVYNCGITNSHGQPSTGSDVVLQELQQAKMTYPDMYWE